MNDNFRLSCPFRSISRFPCVFGGIAIGLSQHKSPYFRLFLPEGHHRPPLQRWQGKFHYLPALYSVHNLRFTKKWKIRRVNLPLLLELSLGYCSPASERQSYPGTSPPKLARYTCGAPFTIAKFAATVGGASKPDTSLPPRAFKSSLGGFAEPTANSLSNALKYLPAPDLPATQFFALTVECRKRLLLRPQAVPHGQQTP